MRCLHCGSTISAFKKLTDTDFCSAGHREQFRAAQQRLILNRLKQSAERFQRVRRNAATLSDPTRVGETPAITAVLEEHAPPQIAPFLYAKLDPLAGEFRPAVLPALDPPVTGPRIPKLNAWSPAGATSFAPLVRDLLQSSEESRKIGPK